MLVESSTIRGATSSAITFDVDVDVIDVEGVDELCG